MKFLPVIGFCLLATRLAFAQNPAPTEPRGAAHSATLQAGPSAPTIHPAVVRIVALGKGSISYGSGTLVYADDQLGVVLTNWHVINEVSADLGPFSRWFLFARHHSESRPRLGPGRDCDQEAEHPTGGRSQPGEAHPGEVLTIAGYGQGDYRTASGRCTQYVAPGTTFPFEMVEVAVSAQGDSGGPIFNSRGELAGVLFGEGHGRTSGSYCGRVKWFLSSVVPDIGETGRYATAADKLPSAVVTQSLVTDASRSSHTAATSATPAQGATNRTVRFGSGAPPAQFATAQPDLDDAQFFGWQDIAGQTTGEQVKTVLAGVGVLAILLHALRWMSTERQAA